MAQRRSLFEVLGIFTYVIAVVLSVFSILSWTSQPYFVAGCTAIWMLFSLSVVTRFLWGNQSDKVLEIPDAWDEPAVKNQIEEGITPESHAATVEPADTLTSINDRQAAESNKIGIRTARLQQYRHERLSRYRQKRRNRRAVTSNLATYRKLSGNCTSSGN